jgi:hypothetical protein
MLVKNCYIVTKFSGGSAWIEVANWKAIIVDSDGPRGICGKESKLSGFHRWFSVCGQKARTHSIMFNWDRGSSVGIATGYGLDGPGIESRGKSRGSGNGKL